jgi:hypothetical protein
MTARDGQSSGRLNDGAQHALHPSQEPDDKVATVAHPAFAQIHGDPAHAVETHADFGHEQPKGYDSTPDKPEADVPPSSDSKPSRGKGSDGNVGGKVYG